MQPDIALSDLLTELKLVRMLLQRQAEGAAGVGVLLADGGCTRCHRAGPSGPFAQPQCQAVRWEFQALVEGVSQCPRVCGAAAAMSVSVPAEPQERHPSPADEVLVQVVAAAAARPPGSAGFAAWPPSEEVVRAVKVDLHTSARA